MAEKENTVSILNLSKHGRRYDLPDGRKLLPNQAIEIPAKEAEFLLSKLASGRARYPDLADAAKLSPEAAKVKQDLLRDNAQLLKENDELRAQLAAKDEEKDGKKGGKK